MKFTLEELVILLLKKRIAFSYDPQMVSVNNPKNGLPAFMACYHPKAGILVRIGNDSITIKQL